MYRPSTPAALNAERPILPFPYLQRPRLFVDIFRLGVPELPWMGPFAMATVLAGVAGFVGFAPSLLGFYALASVGLSLGFIRLDARARGTPGGLAEPLWTRALSAAPKMCLVLLVFSLCCVLTFALASILSDLIGIVAGASIAVCFGVLCARLMAAAPLVAVDGLGVYEAFNRAWLASAGSTVRLTVATLVGVSASICLAGAPLTIVDDVTSLGLAFVASCGLVLPLDAVFVYAVYARVQDRGA